MTDDAARDAAWHEREYNPRLTVPDTTEIVAAWPIRALATRQARYPLCDISTGAHPRECLDLFRDAEPKGTLVFLHGGYWRAFSKNESSWVADGFVDQGYSVAIVNYPLCPEVSLATLTQSVRNSFAHLWKNVLNAAERQSIVVAGHSAGGYLTAALVATDWTAYGLPPAPFNAAVPISGLFELAPLIYTSMNTAIGLDAQTAAALSLIHAAPAFSVSLTFVVGGDESGEFHRQSRIMAQAWAQLSPRVISIAGKNHFTVVENLADQKSELSRIICAKF